MKRIQVKYNSAFHILGGNARAQAAVMVLAPGKTEGGPDNRHVGTDQWLYVVSGTGRATVNQRSVALKEGTLLLIEKSETHEIRNTGRRPLHTLNFYVPPEY